MTMERSNRARLTTAFILFLLLAVGFALGVAVNRTLMAGGVGEEELGTGDREADWRRPGGEDEGERGDRKDRGRSRLIVEEVGLSESQKATVDSIVAFHRERMRELHEEFEEAYIPRYRAVIEETRESIKTILTPEQRTAYDSLLARHDRRREEWDRDRREGPRPPERDTLAGDTIGR
jgi:hypothetical protein